MSAAIEKMFHTAVENGFPESKLSERQVVIATHANTFDVSFFLGPFAKIPPIRIDLIPDALLCVSAYGNDLRSSANLCRSWS